MPPPLHPDEAERRAGCIERHGGNCAAAAAELGIVARSLWKWWRDHRRRAGVVPPVVAVAGAKRLGMASHGWHVPVPDGAGPPPDHDIGDVIRVVVVSDAHDKPALADKSRFRWIGAHIRETAPDVLHQLGDFMDFESLCSHVKNETYDGKLKPTFSQDLASGVAAMEALEGEIAKGSHNPVRTASGDNHADARINRYEQNNPEMYGILRAQYDKVWTDFGYHKTPYGAFTFHGGVGFTHIPLNVMGREMGGETVLRQVALKSTHDVVMGHIHYFDCHKARMTGFNNSVRAVSCPTALPHGYVAQYAAHGMTGWDWGVLELSIAAGRIAALNMVPMFELERRYG